ncbi:hypothetical protein GVX82_03410 [Patescibacteria group bacterium]|jgi:hypothetical protein|nr:hypothetical protein [Patescibacteria group bacterium]
MLRIILLALVLLSASAADADSTPFFDASLPEGAQTAYRSQLDVAFPSITEPTLIELRLGPRDDLDRAALVNRETREVVPFVSRVANEPLTFSVTSPERADQGTLQELTDDRASSFVEFPFMVGGDNSVTLSVNRVRAGAEVLFRARGLTLTLPPSVEAPTRVSVLDVSGERVLLDRAPLADSRIRFPEVVTRELQVTLELAQPLRLAEVAVEGTEPAPEFTALRFLGLPDTRYRLYLDPDRTVDLPRVEPGSYERYADEPLVVRAPERSPNPRYRPVDRDGDGVPDARDVCPRIEDPGQEDQDGDGVGDACEDTDADGIADARDNCPLDPNRAQRDTDADGVGDVCDEREDRLTERHAWLPWAGMGIAVATLVALFTLTMLHARREEPSGAGEDRRDQR